MPPLWIRCSPGKNGTDEDRKQRRELTAPSAPDPLSLAISRRGLLDSGAMRRAVEILLVVYFAFLVYPDISTAWGANLLFPQFVNGTVEGGLPNRSRLTLMNQSQAAVSGEIRFFAPDSTALTVPIGGTDLSSASFEIPPLGTFELQTDGTGALLNGTVVVSFAPPGASLTGILVYEVLGHLVSVPASTAAASQRQVVRVTQSESTAVAIYNPGTRSTKVHTSLQDSAGEVVTEGDITLEPHRQLSKFITEAEFFKTYFEEHPAPFLGSMTLEVTQGGPVATMALVQRGADGALMTLPSPTSGYFRTAQTRILDPLGDPILLRGINLGGWLVPEGYILHLPGYGSPTSIRNMIQDLAGEETTREFFARYRECYVTEADIDQIARWGFNSIRLPFHYLDIYDPSSDGFREEGFLLLRRLLDWCGRHGLAVVLDMHCAPGGQNGDNISDSPEDTGALLWGAAGQSHRDLSVRIWREIARRFADDPWLIGYDLLNEPVMPQGTSNQDLRSLYIRLASAVREVDPDHILFIEGSWYATDFSNLTPPFDSNLVYSFHKYWNGTDRNSIQAFLNLRQTTQAPLWLGEFGENSNVWATQSVDLVERGDIGWCWWTHKKLETISSPVSAPIPPDYQSLLDYWEGRTTVRPTADSARTALLDMADHLALSSCTEHPDVLFALFDPNRGTAPVPSRELTIPGVIDAVDYDLGTDGTSYHDGRSQRDNYVDSTPWNMGWQYRNDGVDIETSTDPDGAPFDVGWIETGEWLSYTVNVGETGLYDLEIRVATPQTGGRLQVRWDGTALSPQPIPVPLTGGWQNWMSLHLVGLLLNAGNHTLRLEMPVGGYNLGRLEFQRSSQ